MIISIGEKSIELYLKNILSELFPEYSFNEKLNISVFSEIIKNDKTISVKLLIEDSTYTAQEKFSDHHNERIALTTAAGKAVIKYAISKGKNLPPYGVLTGVRPFKIASSILLYCDDETASSILKNNYLISDDKIDLLLCVAKKDLEAKKSHNSNDCSIYISIPFCPTRCNYCSFISSAAPSQLATLKTYLDILTKEIKLYSDLICRTSLNVKSIYVGGGTPTILNDVELKAFIKTIKECLPIENSIEFTFEAGRPDTITKNKLEILKQGGVDRICINCQTTSDKVLKAIGRSHTKDDFFCAFETAKSYSFKTINTDVIAGLDSDNLDSFTRTINDVISLSPENITVHTLALKKSADIKISNQLLSKAPDVSDFITYSKSTCISNGYVPYYLYRQKYSVGNHENVGFAKPSHESHYNIAMMNEIEHVLGIGAGATSRIIASNSNVKIQHFENFKYPSEYIKYNKKTATNIEEIERLLSTEIYS